MNPKNSFDAAQRRYDNLTPEDMHKVGKRKVARTESEDDFEDETYYKSKAFSRVMDAYERQIYGD